MPDDAPDRADVLKRKPSAIAGLALKREFQVRALRSLMVLNGQDPQIGDATKLPNLNLLDTVGYTMLLQDASQPPFRNNGKAFITQVALAANVGGGGMWSLGLLPSSQSGQSRFYAAAVIDAIHYEGASDLTYGKSGQGNLVTTAANFTVTSVEDPTPNFPVSPGSTPTVLGLPVFANLFLTTSNTVVVTAFNQLGFVGGTAAAGPGVSESFGGGLVIWPGEMFTAVMDTVNVKGRLMIRGRYFDFPNVATGTLPV